MAASRLNKIGFAIFLFVLAFFLIILAFSIIADVNTAEELDEQLEMVPYYEIEPQAEIDKTYPLGSTDIYVKNVPERHKKLFSIVCGVFPELKDEDITVVEGHISTTGQARPDFGTVFSKNIKYEVFINNNPDFEGILLDSVPFNGQVGFLVHEFNHILDYKTKSRWQILETGLFFLSKKKREVYEKKVDYMTILKGAGWQLEEWSDFAINQSDATPDYKAFKAQYYLEPYEIDSICRLIYNEN